MCNASIIHATYKDVDLKLLARDTRVHPLMTVVVVAGPLQLLSKVVNGPLVLRQSRQHQPLIPRSPSSASTHFVKLEGGGVVVDTVQGG